MTSCANIGQSSEADGSCMKLPLSRAKINLSSFYVDLPQMFYHIDDKLTQRGHGEILITMVRVGRDERSQIFPHLIRKVSKVA